MIDRAQLPMYDGRDLHLVEEPRCFQCFQTPTTKLLQCFDCGVAWYCNVSCRDEHRKEHRGICGEICYSELNVNYEKSALGRYALDFAGGMWNADDNTPYMEATYDFADAYWRAAYECEVKQAWEKALYHMLMHIRTGGVEDTLGARFRVPFILLALNRDDDAFTFIHYFWQIDKDAADYGGFYGAFESIDSFNDIDNDTDIGDWMYPSVEKDCRYKDLFRELPYLNPQELELPFLVALVIMKLRIVAAHDATMQSIELVMNGTSGRRIQEVQLIVTEMLIRDDIETQHHEVNRLLTMIHLLNPSMLPALVNPKPLLDQPSPKCFIRGHPSEVHRILVDGRRCFCRVPGALDMLQRRFGSEPTYNWDMSS